MASQDPNQVKPDPVKDAQEKAFIKVNSILFEDIRAKFNSYPSMGMAALLEQKCKTYSALRKAFGDAAVQQATSAPDTSDVEISKTSSNAEFHIPDDVEVIQPLDKAVIHTLPTGSISGEPGLSTVVKGLNRQLASSEVIWRLGSTAVLGLNKKILMKVGYGIDIDRVLTLKLIKQHTPHLPVPDIYGIIRQPDTNRNFIFMTRVPGEPLNTIWNTLSVNQKSSIKRQLEAIVNDFRFIPAPSTEETNAVLGSGIPRRCKDTRREIRVAETPISNENEFIEFITSNPRRSGGSWIALILSYLDESHRIVLTHGDLHPRNIMVTITPFRHSLESQVIVTGILDWEMCGWYPEYWEYVKALNTITLGGNNGVWAKEHAVDIMLSRWHG